MGRSLASHRKVPDQPKRELDKLKNLCYSKSMRPKYKKGDVVCYTNPDNNKSIFVVNEVKPFDHCYEVYVFSGFEVGTRCTNTYEDHTIATMNTFFVDKHCRLYEGPDANAIRILYGNSDQTR